MRLGRPAIPVQVFAVAVAGSRAPWGLVTTAWDRSAVPVVEACAAWVRQEDGGRAHTPRLGMDECRAGTTAPVLRTFPGHMVALTRRRLCRLDQTGGQGSGGRHPPGTRRYVRGRSVSSAACAGDIAREVRNASVPSQRRKPPLRRWLYEDTRSTEWPEILETTA